MNSQTPSAPLCPDQPLTNATVQLVPVAEAHREPLRAIALDDRIWRHFTTRITDSASFDRFFDLMLADHASGKRVVFVVFTTKENLAAGSMSYGNINLPERRLEIGWSWLGSDFQGKGINTWAKYELLKYGFDQLDLLRMEFKTDVRNIGARKALVKIGGTEEGVLRCFNTMPDGSRRDAVYYSVLASEWPEVRRRWQS